LILPFEGLDDVDHHPVVIGREAKGRERPYGLNDGRQNHRQSPCRQENDEKSARDG
jgi:hypothetical protein